MRSALLLVVLLLAGCASEPPAPDVPSVTASPSPSATPRPPTAPTLGVPPFVLEKDGWTAEVRPALFDGQIGDRLAFEIVLRHPSPPESTLAVSTDWAGLVERAVPVREPETQAAGSLVLGRDDRLRFNVAWEEDAVFFEGPPLVAERGGVTFDPEERLDVSDDAPGLSVEVSQGRVRVTFAARENATTTADEHVSAEGAFELVGSGDDRVLVGFLTLASNDAVSPLPEPQRSRVIVDAEVAPGPLRVVVATRAVCFCYGQAPPGVQVEDVVVPG